MDIRPLEEGIAASPQIDIADIERLHDLGYRLIVNNRPDGEAPDQTPGGEIEAAAQAAGIAYVSIPVGRDPLTEVQLEELSAALDAAEGPALLYCRSGTRSTTLWAFAEARRGRDSAELIAAAAAAGYDLRPHEPVLRQLAGR